jgi:hypothetical protein
MEGVRRFMTGRLARAAMAYVAARFISSFTALNMLQYNLQAVKDGASSLQCITKAAVLELAAANMQHMTSCW